MTTQLTNKEIRAILADNFCTVSFRKGVWTVRTSFFYPKGKTASNQVAKVESLFPEAKIVDKGEVWKAFNGGASVANQSHWFVKFML